MQLHIIVQVHTVLHTRQASSKLACLLHAVCCYLPAVSLTPTHTHRALPMDIPCRRPPTPVLLLLIIDQVSPAAACPALCVYHSQLAPPSACCMDQLCYLYAAAAETTLLPAAMLRVNCDIYHSITQLSLCSVLHATCTSSY